MSNTVTIPETFSVGPTHKQIRNDPMLAACYLCGKNGKLTKEHAIPQAIYRPNHIERPIVLRACQDCNGQKKSLEDQYAAHTFHATSFSKGADQLMRHWVSKTILSGNPTAPGMGLVNNMRNNLQPPIQIKTPTGILHSQTPAGLKLDSKRIDDFFGSIAKGLTIYELGKIIDWEQYTVNVLHEQALATNHRIRNNPSHPFWTGMTTQTFAREWDDYFSFSGSAVVNPKNSNEYAALWSFIVYLSHLAVVIISPKDAK